jgi:carbamoyl-phosphate synthase large subunit
MNTTEGAASLADSASIRRTAVSRKIPYFTTIAASLAAVRAITSMKSQEITVRALQSV